MRVIYFSQYFPPEVGATQARAHDMARALVRAGHSVVVICEFPNHPHGRIPARYRGKLYERDTLDGIEVLRVWVRAATVKTFRTRMMFYLSYMAAAIAAGLLLARQRADVVYATSPPLFVGVAGAVVSCLRRVPFVLEVRDPWPAAAVALGELSSRSAIGAARWLERRCYRHAKTIVTVTDGWRAHLREQGVESERIALIPNGANPQLFHPQPEAGARVRRALGLDGKFVVLYAGLHGLAQGVHTLLDAAARLDHEPDIAVLLLGEGPLKAELLETALERGLDRVRFHHEVPRSEMAAYFSMADVAVVLLRKVPLLRGAVPLKALEAWASGCPIVAAAEGELARLVDQSAAGLCVDPEDGGRLADAIRRLRDDRQACRAMGERGREFVARHYNREVQGRKLVDILDGVVPAPRRRG